MTNEQGSVFIQNAITTEQFDINARVVEHATTTIQKFESVLVAIKSKKNDLLSLAIAYASTVPHTIIVDCSYMYRGDIIKKYGNCTKLNEAMRNKYKIDSLFPLIVLHALTGSQYTSAIRNITKATVINTYFRNMSQYKYIEHLGQLPFTNEIGNACENLFLQALKSGCRTLDEERHFMIRKAPRKYEDITALKALPPTSDAAHQHFKRASVAVNMWCQNTQPDICKNNGYKMINGTLNIIWITKPIAPDASQIIACGCKTGNCQACSCEKNNLKCVPKYCSCDEAKCTRR
ncbi:unnamed protein product [Didymodactylos carnosus]|uniref:Tesmin/TSO1-like CXC domain-containing protein n=1 Tax=Didymodactylos carnosus TaxID=1234261 RepID=A0A814ZEE4_9BILA|nr:unnamed protein product [Didymodactylos carnosus]CAF1242973.1 unnamed protein product [Didymodactylos carnosus]CAF3930731.1 unnamed protein product [Didymodactylos carnosus]CAF4007021.1 unnamed protein product [Didymodactylos carnosus]